MEHDPFAVVEAMAIEAFAVGADKAYLYIRGEYPLAEARIANAIAATRDGWSPRRPRHRAPARRRRLHLRRGDGALRVDRGQARRAPQQAAVPGRGRPVRQADGGQQRRDARQRPADRRRGRRRRRVPGDRHGGLDRPEALLRQRPRRAARASTRSSSGRRFASCSSWRAACPAAEALKAVLLGGAAGVFVGPGRARHAADVRGDPGDRGDARLRRRHGVRRDRRHGRHAPADRPVLPRRVVRPVRPVPGRDRPPGGAAGPPRRRRSRSAAASDELALLAEIGQAMRDASICGLGQTASARRSRARSASRSWWRCERRAEHGSRSRPRSAIPHEHEAPGAQPLTEIILDPAARPSRPPAPPPAPPRPEVELTIDGADRLRPGRLDDPRRLPCPGDRHADTLLSREPDPGQRLPRLCRRGHRARASSSRPARARSRPGWTSDRLGAGPPQPEDGPRVPRLVGRSLDRAVGRRLHRALRRRHRRATDHGAARRGRRARRPRAGPPPRADRRRRPQAETVPSRSRSTTTCTSATTRSASSATSASRPAARTPRTRSRSPSRGAASTPGSPPRRPSRCPTRRASTAATASASARPAR